MKSDYISRSALSKRLTFLAMNGAAGHQRAYAKCVNEVETAPNGQMWIDANRALPADSDIFVLVIANYQCGRSPRLNGAYELATYSPDEGWILEAWPELVGVEVTHWMPLPEPPKEES